MVNVVKKTVRKKKKVAKLLTYERGKSKVLILVVIILIMAGLGGLFLFSQKTGVSLPGMKAALNPNCSRNDPELCKFLNNWQGQKHYSVASTSSFGGSSMETIYEVAGTDTFHMITKQGGKERSNVITMGDTTYTLDYADNKWWKQTYKEDTTETAKPEMEIKTEFDEQGTEDTSNYKFIAKEACGDMMCFKYQIIDSTSDSSIQYLWFDDKEYLIRKMKIQDKENGMMESVYTYGGVNITVPSPVKEGTPGPSSSGYSDEEVQKMMKQYQQSPQNEETTDTNTEAPVDDSSSSDY